MNDTLHIRVEYFSGHDADDDTGYPYYVASCDEIVAVTDGRTWNDLLRNVHTMIAAALEGEDTQRIYNLLPQPRIVITMELPENYAEIA
jgi:hypothetical protein